MAARTILVPLDGSLFSERALPVATSLARRLGGTLHVVRIHVPYTRPPLSLEGMPVRDPERDSRLWEAERGYVTRIRKRLGPRSELATRIAVLNGPVAETLAAYAASNNVDLIVMSTHGRRGLSRAWMGSIGDALLRCSPVPILLVRSADDRRAVAGTEAPMRILIALDGSALAAQIVEHAVSVGRPLAAEYTLLRAVAAQHVAEAKAYLAEIARLLKDRGLDVKTTVIESERAADAILTEAARHGFGLVAMATHGRMGVSRLVLGSVATRVLQRASVPVLLYRPRAAGHRFGAQPAEVAAAI